MSRIKRKSGSGEPYITPLTRSDNGAELWELRTAERHKPLFIDAKHPKGRRVRLGTAPRTPEGIAELVIQRNHDFANLDARLRETRRANSATYVPTWREAVDLYINGLGVEQQAIATKEERRRMLHRHCKSIASMLITSVGSADINKVLQEAAGRGLVPSTINHLRHGLRGTLRAAFLRHQCENFESWWNAVRMNAELKFTKGDDPRDRAVMTDEEIVKF